MGEVEDLIDLIERKMQNGVSRLSIGFSDEVEAGTKKERRHHGRCDVGSPWATGTVSNCDIIDRNEAWRAVNEGK